MKPLTSYRLVVAIVCGAFLLPVCPASAQSQASTGQIGGRVVDLSGAVLQGSFLIEGAK